ncbi:MAG: hypothetical protein NVSMB57_09070 [Actinomycetota bacterium]
MAVYWCVWCGNVRAGGPSKRPGSCEECAKTLRYMIARLPKQPSTHNAHANTRNERIIEELAQSRRAS